MTTVDNESSDLPSAEMLSEEILSAFFDGELSDEESQAIEAKLDKDAIARLESYGRLSEALRATGEFVATDLDSDALWNKIDNAIKVESMLDGADAVPASGGFFGGAVGKWTMVGAFIAAAALLYFTTQGTHEAANIAKSDRAGVVDDNAGGQGVVEEKVAVVRGSEVMDVDFGDSTGTVFQVEGAEGTRVAVVWIEDEFFDDEEVVDAL